MKTCTVSKDLKMQGARWSDSLGREAAASAFGASCGKRSEDGQDADAVQCPSWRIESAWRGQLSATHMERATLSLQGPR